LNSMIVEPDLKMKGRGGKMMKKEQDNRRSFLKQMLAGTAAVVGTGALVKSAKAKSSQLVQRPDEVLYREGDNFSKYYKSLRS